MDSFRDSRLRESGATFTSVNNLATVSMRFHRTDKIESKIAESADCDRLGCVQPWNVPLKTGGGVSNKEPVPH